MEDAYVTADRTSAKQRTKAAELEQARKTALRELLSTAHGRRFLWDELSFCAVFSATYVPNSFDRTAFNEGKRTVGNRLMADIVRWFPSSYLTMTTENASVKLDEVQPQETSDE